MQVKKHPKVDLEKKKGVYAAIGLFMAVAIVLSALEFRTIQSYTPDDQGSNRPTPEIDDVDIIPITREKIPEQPKRKKAASKQLTKIITEFLIDDATEEDPVEITSLELNEKDVQLASNSDWFGTEEIDEEKIPFIYVEEMPEFKGGELEMRKYLKKHIKYPAMAKDDNIQGKVYLSFIVEKDGSISNVEVERSLRGGCSEEAKRVVENMPNWKPGKQSGKKKRVKFYLPIEFKLR